MIYRCLEIKGFGVFALQDIENSSEADNYCRVCGNRAATEVYNKGYGIRMPVDHGCFDSNKLRYMLNHMVSSILVNKRKFAA